MFKYQSDITQDAKFNSDDYPNVVSELTLLKQITLDTPGDHKTDIILSYLKDHCVKIDWIDANPKLVRLIVSNPSPMLYTETLFESCRHNESFLQDFEAYIKMKFIKLNTANLKPRVSSISVPNYNNEFL